MKLNNFSKSIVLSSAFFLILIASGCHSVDSCTNPIDSDGLTANVQKWFHGKKAAISITYDGGWLPELGFSTEDVLTRGIKMDFEMVTANYDNQYGLSLMGMMSDSIYNSGIHYFGHGHYHYAHDTLPYDSAYNNFRKCFLLMQEWNLKPKAYAYPHSSGWLDRTQRANRDAGWLMARGYTPVESEYYICPQDVDRPTNWYYLPSVFIAHDPSFNSVHNHEELGPIIKKAATKESWIILMYHNIGAPQGWGYYPIDQFEQDLDQIQSLDFWAGNFDDVGLYIMEKNNFEFKQQKIYENDQKVTYETRFLDYFDNSIYNQPLTVDIEINSPKNYSYVILNPPINKSDSLVLDNNKVTIDVIPDEKKYSFVFHL